MARCVSAAALLKVLNYTEVLIRWNLFYIGAYTLRVAKKLAKERGAFLLVFVLMLLLVSWWGISSFALRASDASLAHSAPTVDNAYRPKGPVVVHHRVVGETHTYSGSLDISAECDMLATSIAADGVVQTHVVVSLTVLHSNDGCASPTLAPAPFSVSFSSTKSASVIFDGITVQNKKTSSSLVELN